MVKLIHFQRCDDVDPEIYPYIAMNHDGVAVGFKNPPIRNFDLGVWIDSTDGSFGEIIPYGRWDTSVRKSSELDDIRARSSKNRDMGQVKKSITLSRNVKRALKRRKNER